MKKLRTRRMILLAVVPATIMVIAVFTFKRSDNINTNEEQEYSDEEIQQIYESATEEIPYNPEETKGVDTNTEETGIEISAWIPYWDMNRSKTVFKENPDFFSSLSPTWYSLNADGSLGLKNTARDGELIELCRKNNTRLIPSISNSNPDELSKIINDPQLMNTHVNNIVAEVVNFDLDGIDIDYEQIKSADRNKFSEFISLLGQKLHEKNKELTIAILWKDELAEIIDQFSESRGAQDWEEIGKHVDEFRIMVYDYTGSADHAGPIAPKNWIESIVEYAVTVVDKEKIVIGFPFYAYDWVIGNKGAKALVWTDINYIRNTHTIISDEFNSDKLEKELKYQVGGVNRVVWYQDAEVTEKRIELIESYGIDKFVFWRLGGEDPGIYYIDR